MLDYFFAIRKVEEWSKVGFLGATVAYFRELNLRTNYFSIA